MAANTEELRVNKWTLRKPCIARSSNSEVYIGRICSEVHMEESVFAVKMVTLERPEKPLSWAYWGALLNEVQRMRELNHPNILKCVKTFVDSDEVGIVMPVMSFGSTRQLLQAHFPTGLPEPAVGLIMKDVLSALVYLHDHHYIHNGVKPSHILINREGHAVLSGTRFMIQTKKRQDKVLKLKYLSEMTENLNWLSPEILLQNRDGFTNKADVYSLGLTCITLATGMMPFDETSASAMLIKKLNEAPPCLLQACDNQAAGEPFGRSLQELRLEEEFSKEAQNFTSLCTIKEFVRPTSAELIKDKFIKMACQSGVTLLKVLDKVKCIEAQSPGNSGHSVHVLNSPNQPSSNISGWDFED